MSGLMIEGEHANLADEPSGLTNEAFGAEFPAMQMVRTGRLTRLFARTTAILLALCILALIFVPWRQTASGTGSVIALDPQQRPQPVKSPAKGIIAWVQPGLNEGSRVKKGDILIRLTPFAEDGVNLVESQLAAIEAKLNNSNTAIANAKLNATRQIEAGKQKMQQLRADVEEAKQKYLQAEDEVLVMEADFKDKKNKADIAGPLYRAGIEPQEKYFSKQQAANAAYRRYQQAKNYVLQTAAEFNSKERKLEAEAEAIDIKNREAEQKVLLEQAKMNQIQKEYGDIQSKRGELARLEVPAPRSGVIQQWTGISGSDTIKEGDVLFTIVPDVSELVVEMKVAGNEMPLIHEGDPVRVQFQGWPALPLAGWPDIAFGTFGGTVRQIFPTDDGKGNFRILISPKNFLDHDDGWPNDQELKQGVRANGWVLLNEVPLGYEIWRLLNGFPPVIGDRSPGRVTDDTAG